MCTKQACFGRRKKRVPASESSADPRSVCVEGRRKVSCERVPKVYVAPFVYGVPVAPRPQTQVEVRECTVEEGIVGSVQGKERRTDMLQVLRLVSGGEADPILSWHHEFSCALSACPIGREGKRKWGLDERVRTSKGTTTPLSTHRVLKPLPEGSQGSESA